MVRTRTLVLACLASLAVGCVGAPAPPASDGTPTATATATATPTANGTLEVHVVDVGQAESTLVVGPTETMLVDTGGFTDDGATVLRYLRSRGIDRIDHLVLTHADADHIGGTAAIIDYYEREADGVGAVYDPGIAAATRTYERYLDAVERHDVPLYETRTGDRIAFADADVDVLAPPEPYLANRDRNENSIVLELTHGRAQFLLTGDAGHREETYLLNTHGDSLRATVLKVGHHGSATGTSGQFLAAVDPVVAAISSAYDSQYGHPAESVLERLAARRIDTYWTGTHGAVRFTSDGRQIVIATQRPAPTDPARLRQGEPAPTDVTAPLARRAVVSVGNRTVATPPAATPVPDGGTEPNGTRLALVTVNADAAGDDRGNLDDEFLVFENRGATALNLSGWTVRDAAGATYEFPDGFTLRPGARVTLHTGTGTDSATDLYWNRDRPVWNNDGDTVTVIDAAGDDVLTEVYG